MKVRCIDSSGRSYLRNNRAYDYIDRYDGLFLVRDESGELHEYVECRFEIVDEPKEQEDGE